MSQTQFVKFRQNMLDKSLDPYREHLKNHAAGLVAKRVFDIFASLLCIIVMFPFFLIAVAMVKTTKGPVFYRQLRVGKDCRELYVLKLRTMVVGADKSGEITVGSTDSRITRVGRILRATNFDEFPQLFQVLAGSMSIVGVRPEVPHYVELYTPEDYATLLMKPGLTSPVAIAYRHENDMLAGCDDPERKYVEEILPAKMKLNRQYVQEFSFLNDLKIIGRSFKCIFEKDEMLNKQN
ncbi:sugar transferase [[Clostridium] cellulosi]|uniref:Sugar transferase n=1 Tax=[Clostridium] cellulosi TaxID=29343 RepID=A0A078KN34_9FIRM|nr:sugar transferase [[Clostridium] cellulosi]